MSDGFESWWEHWTKSRAMTGLPIRPDSVKVMCQQAYDRGRAEVLAELGDTTEHVIQFRADGWTMRHPLACRPNLFKCPLNKALEKEDWGLERPGFYEVSLGDEGPVIGRRLEAQ